MAHNETDCRTETEKTVGLIDNIINSAHILAERKLKSSVVQEALKYLFNDQELLSLMHGEHFIGNNKPKEVRYKSGTILTDGKGFIMIGYVREKNWSPKNVYGDKYDEYVSCTHYPASKPNDPKGWYLNGDRIYSGYSGHMPGLWLQKGYSLSKFRPIEKKLIHPDILKKLEGK